MICFYCSEEAFIEDTTTGDLVCTRCGSCALHHVTFGDDIPRRPELNPSYFEEAPEKAAEDRGKIENDPFMASLKELSRFVCIDRRAICRFHRATLSVVEKDPALRFVLPAAVVLGVYCREREQSEPGERSRRSERNKPVAELESLCAAMKLKACTVARILKKLT